MFCRFRTIHRFRGSWKQCASVSLAFGSCDYVLTMCILCLDDFSSDKSICFPKPSPQKKEHGNSSSVHIKCQHLFSIPVGFQNQNHYILQLNLKPIGSMCGIFTYVYHQNQPNVGKYTSPMDPMGNYKSTPFQWHLGLLSSTKKTSTPVVSQSAMACRCDSGIKKSSSPLYKLVGS